MVSHESDHRPEERGQPVTYVPDPTAPGTYRRETPEEEPTDWGAVYEQFVDLNPDMRTTNAVPVDEFESPPEEPMAIDWGGAASGFIDLLQGQQPGGGNAFVGPQPTIYTPPPGAVPTPAKVTVDTRTGAVTHCRRRRRRRLLTPTDLSDLAALAAIVGKGDALKMAVAKAVRR